MPMNCRKLKGLMAENNITISRLSSITGISPRALALKIKGEREWLYHEVINITKQLGYSEVREVFPEMYNHVLSSS